MANSVEGFRYVKKTPFTSSEKLIPIICKFRVLLKATDSHINHQARSLTNGKYK